MSSKSPSSGWSAEGSALGTFALGLIGSAVSYAMLPAAKRWWILPAAVACGGLVKWFGSGGKCNYKGNLSGKVAIITGANTGIGKASAIELASQGCEVILACRSAERGHEAALEVKAASKSDKVQVMKLDLSSLASVRQFAKEFESKNLPCHILLNNAGVMMCPYGLTQDKFETQFGTNHLGHFLLTNLLLDNLKQSQARIVNVSSRAHLRALPNLNFHEVAFPDPKKYNPSVAYANSKLANVLFTIELQKRLKGSGANAYSLHPGVVRTELGRHLPQWLSLLISPLAFLMMKSSYQGCQTSLYCCIHPDAKGGEYYSDCQVWQTSAAAKDEKSAEELWRISEQLVGLDK